MQWNLLPTNYRLFYGDNITAQTPLLIALKYKTGCSRDDRN